MVSICGELYSIFNRRFAHLHMVGKYVPSFLVALLGFSKQAGACLPSPSVLNYASIALDIYSYLLKFVFLH